MLGILVEEALIARGIFDLQKTNDLSRKSKYRNESNMFNSSLSYSDLDELISDKGITYNNKTHKHKPDNIF